MIVMIFSVSKINEQYGGNNLSTFFLLFKSLQKHLPQKEKQNLDL